MRATEFGRQIYRVAIAWRREIDLRVRDFGLTEATWRPLLHLGRLGDHQRQTDLASALMIEDASLVRLVDALERSGFVERVEDPDDRRSKRIVMTDTGRAIYARVAEVYMSLADNFLKDVPAADLAICDAVLSRVLLAIENESLSHAASTAAEDETA